MTIDLFGVRQRRKPRVMMHVVDAGIFPDGKNCIKFECASCGHNTGWMYDTKSVSANKRGMLCPVCNKEQEAGDEMPLLR